jgi:hypothetical protein
MLECTYLDLFFYSQSKKNFRKKRELAAETQQGSWKTSLGIKKKQHAVTRGA